MLKSSGGKCLGRDLFWVGDARGKAAREVTVLAGELSGGKTVLGELSRGVFS